MSIRKRKLPLSEDNPCQRNCCLNEEDICVGCFRHVDEIKEWSKFDETEKLNLMVELDKRRKDHKNKWGWS